MNAEPGGPAALAVARRLCRTKNHRYRMFGDEGVVVLLERGEVVAVNAVGSRLLDMWRDERTLEHAAQMVSEEYEVECEVAFGDVVAFAQQMIELGVLEERIHP